MVRSVAVLLLASVAGAQNLFYDSYTTTSTGLVEEYYVAYPTGEPPGGLVVAFHGTGFSPAGTYQEIVELNNDGDPDTDWDFLARATAPPYGFYVLMLDGGWDHNQATHHTFGREAFQDTAQETIERVCSQYPIDTNRIFGMGFSMGGGEVMSFAARHLNPNKPGMFAAIINHTGGVSVPYTYNYVSAPAGREYLEDLYGLTPGDTYCDDPLPFQRASVIDVADCCNSGQSCPAQGQVAYETSIAHNVSHVPILRYYSPNDSSASLVYQTEMLDEFMQTTQHFNYIKQTTQPNGNGIYHAWNVIPSGQALPFFNLYSLQIPTTATTLATEDTRYFHFRVKRDDVDALAPFTWEVDAAGNSLDLWDVDNMKRLTVYTNESGLDPAAQLTVEIDLAGGAPTAVWLRDYPTRPRFVCRDGLCGPPKWKNGILKLVENQTGPHTWVVVP